MITLSILADGEAIIDSWPMPLKLMFGIVAFGVMLYFWYSFCLSFERSKRPNFYTIDRATAERWKDERGAGAITEDQTQTSQAQPRAVTSVTIRLDKKVQP